MMPDYTPKLQQLMQQVNLSSFKALSLAAGVSEKQIRQLRQGKIATTRVESLQKLSRVLHVSIADLLNTFSEDASAQSSGGHVPVQNSQELETLRQEYDRLQTKLEQQKQELWQEFQQASLQALESLLLQLPTAAYAAQQNPQAPAVKLLPLLRPIDQLLQQWGIEAIAPVGTEIPYNPQQHQLMEGGAEPGDRVRVRYTGYRQGEKLLYRAKVSPVNESRLL